MKVKVSKYVESATGWPALRIEFVGSAAVMAMNRMFGDIWKFTPALIRSEKHRIGVLLSNNHSTATYQSKRPAEDGVEKKVVILHDVHFKGQTLAKIPNFRPIEMILEGPQITNSSILVNLPDHGQVGEANPQADMFTASKPVPGLKKVLPWPAMRCDLVLKFPDGTKATSKITMIEAAEILGKYIKR